MIKFAGQDVDESIVGKKFKLVSFGSEDEEYFKKYGFSEGGIVKVVQKDSHDSWEPVKLGRLSSKETYWPTMESCESTFKAPIFKYLPVGVDIQEVERTKLCKAFIKAVKEADKLALELSEAGVDVIGYNTESTRVEFQPPTEVYNK